MVGLFYGVMALFAVLALLSIATGLDEINETLKRLNDE